METKSVEIIITNKLGLHARAAAKLTQLTSKFDSEINIVRNDQSVNAKSIMGVMMLAAGMGVTVQIHAKGVDADTALIEIKELFASNFDEEQ